MHNINSLIEEKDIKPLTIEWFHTGCIIVNQGWCHPHNAKNEQSQQEEHHKRLQNASLYALTEDKLWVNVEHKYHSRNHHKRHNISSQ